MAAELQRIWNQSVVVENRTGAGGTIGTDYAAKAAPDGYTLLFAADASVTIAPHLYSKLPYDPVRDLAPIVNVAAGPFVLMANPAFAPNNVKELIALVQTQPGKVSYASSGAGGQQHLAMEYIRTMAGSMDMIHVPYKGFGQGIADVLANQVPLIFGGINRVDPTHEKRQAQGARGHRSEESEGAAERAGGRRDPPRLRHHRLVRLSRACRHAARDREEDPRRLRRSHQAAGLPRAPGPGRNRSGRKHAGRICGADQERPRALGEDRQGGRCQARLTAPPPPPSAAPLLKRGGDSETGTNFPSSNDEGDRETGTNFPSSNDEGTVRPARISPPHLRRGVSPQATGWFAVTRRYR